MHKFITNNQWSAFWSCDMQTASSDLHKRCSSRVWTAYSEIWRWMQMLKLGQARVRCISVPSYGSSLVTICDISYTAVIVSWFMHCCTPLRDGKIPKNVYINAFVTSFQRQLGIGHQFCFVEALLPVIPFSHHSTSCSSQKQQQHLWTMQVNLPSS